jgi:glycerate 2-kinase
MIERSGRDDISAILKSVVQQLDPRHQVSSSIKIHGDRLEFAGVREPVNLPGRVVVIAFGKASVPMASGALDVIGDRVDEAIAVTKSGLAGTTQAHEQLEIIESDHPVPTDRSLAAGQRIRDVAEGLGQDDLAIVVISGGGSALVEDLVDGISLDDLRATTDTLLRAGATINQMNAVRRRLSRLKGGGLAKAIAPARLVNLVVSDVLNSPLNDIASGPTVVPPASDPALDAVCSDDHLLAKLPPAVSSLLVRGSEDGSRWSDNVLGTHILSDAESAARLAVDAAVGRGYRVQTLGFDFQGEARELGRFWSTVARHAARDSHAFGKPIALIGSGEATVTVRGDGVGGRNTEMALAAALEIAGDDGITICSFATDGDDGMSQCAGGIVDGSTIDRVESAGIDAQSSLANNDSATALRTADGLIDLGPTGTNVNDVYIALIS